MSPWAEISGAIFDMAISLVEDATRSTATELYARQARLELLAEEADRAGRRDRAHRLRMRAIRAGAKADAKRTKAARAGR